jgi:trigger factor
MKDKAILDFEVYVDGKLIEGGKADDFALILGEKKMIPGFEENVVGKKTGEKFEFTQSFPDDYHAKNLSGKPAEFKINLKQVLARTKPALDDALAKRVGVDSVDELKKRLSENILKEKTEREEEKVEIAAIKQLVESAVFDKIPQVMIEDTAHDLMHDFEHTLVHQNMKFEQYLQSIGKTHDELKKEFEPRALERVKASIGLGQLAEDEKLTLTNEEIDDELAHQKVMYANQPNTINDIDKPEYRRHVANTLINRKIINFLKDKIVQ